MNWKKLAIVAMPVFGLVLGVPGAVLASGNLVTNGGFENLTNSYGQLGYNTDATGWYSAPPDSSYNFVFNTSTAISGAPSQYNAPVALWGVGNGGPTAITASPDGGNFVAMDGAYNVGPIQQTINGLNIGSSYTVSFYWGAAQQLNFSGPTTDKITVSLGSQSQDTSTISLANHDFDAWHAVSMQFTATAGSEVLSFLAYGTPTGVPPFAVLDGVSMTENISTPEPATLSLVVIGVIGAVAVRRRAKAKLA